MSTLSKANIVNGNVVQAADVSQIIDALTYSGSYNVLINGTLGVGSNTVPASTQLYVNGNISGSSLRVSGDITGGNVIAGTVQGTIYSTDDLHLTRTTQAGYILRPTAPFDNLVLSCEGGLPLSTCTVNATQAYFPGLITGSAIKITNYITASNIGPYSVATVNLPYDGTKVLYGDGSWQTLSVTGFTPLTTYNPFTQSYYVASASFDSRINGIVIPTQDRILSGNTSVVVSGTNVTVSGSSIGTTLLAVSGSITSLSTITANAFIQNSLRALKENIEPFEGNAVELIDTVNIVTYTYKGKPNDYKVGFIADDTHEVFATKKHDALDTGNTIAMLLKAVQELNKRIKILESK